MMGKQEKIADNRCINDRVVGKNYDLIVAIITTLIKQMTGQEWYSLIFRQLPLPAV